MDGAPVKVFAKVGLDTIRVEQVLLDSAERISKSSERLCVVLEESVAKYEKPLTMLIMSIACGIVLVSSAYFIQSAGSVLRKKD